METKSFGDKLRATREKRGLSQQEAAKSLCLNVEIIDALEKEDFNRLPAAVFVRGYIKNYASLLRLSINNPEPATSVTPSSVPHEISKEGELLPLLGQIFLKLLNYIVIITLAVLVFIWWHERHHAMEKVNNTNSIISMSVEETPFKPINLNPTPPILKDQDLMQQLFPWWPL